MLYDMIGLKCVVKCGLNVVKYNFIRCNNGCFIMLYFLIVVSNMVVVVMGKCEKVIG